MLLGKFYIAFLFLLMMYHLALAQKKEVPVSGKVIFVYGKDSLFLDSLSLVPGSLQIFKGRQRIDSSSCFYDYSSGYLHVPRELQTDSLRISYRTLPFSLHAAGFHKSFALYDSNAFFNDIRYARGPGDVFLEKEELFSSPGLTKSGSISRGISFGNRQNIFVNADLNLQLEGALTEDINIRAAISDQNIPLQPEGNTQQLQNFDNVFIEFYNDDGTLTAGDVVLQNPGKTEYGASRNLHDRTYTSGPGQEITPHFLRYHRNVQGGMLKTKYGVGKQGKAVSTAGIALAKGRFASVSLTVQEGIQGPYRLKAQENRQFTGLSGVASQNLNNAYYILANTEKVYLDGRLLQRGYARDYTIDYNLGEISFTSNVLITRNSRVNVDFEYADRSYSRRVLTAGHQQEWGKVTVYTQYFQEKDNPNQTLGFSLTDRERQLLSEAGDQLTEAYISSVDSVGLQGSTASYQNNRNADIPGVGNLYEILYVKKDTLANGVPVQVYEFTGKGEGVYQVDFTFVGEGNGNYRLDNTSVNGKVYVWVAPEGNSKQGNYEAVRLLTTPKNRQLITAGLRAQLNRKDQLFGEVGLSKNDLNTFSALDAQDDLGSALTVGYEAGKRKAGFLPDYEWSGRLQYEFVQKDFTIIDPYRNIEFERNWSVLPDSRSSNGTDVLGKTDDHLLYLQLNLEKDPYHGISYQWTGRKRGEALEGVQHRVEVKQALGHWSVSTDWFHLNSGQPATVSQWDRLHADVHYNRMKIVPGYTFRLDNNKVHSKASDSVLYSAISFEEHQWYLQSGDSLKNKFRLDYGYRTNFSPWEGQMTKTDAAQTVNARSDVAIHKNHDLKLQLTYRHTQILNASALDGPLVPGQENVVMGLIDYSGNFFHNILRTDWNYSVANGRELKREFVYVRVPAGEGNFTWRDDNGNGIEEIEEFYEARYWDERNYVRVYVATNEYILAYTNQLNFRMNLQFPNQWLQVSGIKRLIAKFSNTTSWNITRKIDEDHLNQRLNPLVKTEENHLLYLKESLRSTLFFNRQDTRIGMDAGIRMNGRKQLLNGGFEERSTRSLTFNTRINFSKMIGLRMETEKSLDFSQLKVSQISAVQNGRNFMIRAWRLAPEIAWQPRMNMRITGKYGLSDKQNLQENEDPENGGESAVIHTIGCDLRLSRLLSSTLNASTEYISIRYRGNISSPVSYEMLDALQPGHNVRWTLGWQQKLLDGLQLFFNYQGRKSPAQPAVHTGSMMVKALF